jgi:hypothetical protein
VRAIAPRFDVGETRLSIQVGLPRRRNLLAPRVRKGQSLSLMRPDAHNISRSLMGVDVPIVPRTQSFDVAAEA